MAASNGRGRHFATPREDMRAERVRAKRRNGRIAILVSVLLVLLVGGGVALGFSGAFAPKQETPQTDQSAQESGSSDGEKTQDAATADGSSQEQPDAADAATDDSQADASATEDTSTQTVAADDDRAASLACDPNAQTEWLDHSNGEKTLYLTFDDGPSVNTEKVLDILDQYNAKATFFVTGMNPDYYDMIGEAYRRGHTIGLHTYTHDYSVVYASEESYFNDLDQIGQIVKEQIGYVPYLIRFPGGASNSVSASYCTGIMSALSKDVITRGYQYYDWNVSSGDAAGNTVATADIVEASCNYGNFTNVILLCHDATSKSTTVEALPQIIEYYQSQGFVCKALDRSCVVVHHGINN